MRQTDSIIAVLAAALIGVSQIQAGSSPVSQIKSGSSPQRHRLQPLKVGTYAQLLRLLKTHQPCYFASYRTGLGAMAMNAPIAVAAASSGGTPDFSTTLTQVAGVDEGDQVKTDGNLICQINQGRVLILQTSPAPALASTLDFTDGSFYPLELYLDNHQLVVIGTVFQTPVVTPGLFQPIWFFSTGTVVARIYDLIDAIHPIKTRELELDGDYVASRKIGSCLYFVARQYPSYYAQPQTVDVRPMSGATRVSVPALRTLVPAYRDSKLGTQTHPLGLDRCYYFPGFDDPVYLVIGGLDLTNSRATMDVNAFLGAGDQVYSSLNNLYVTASRPVDIFFAESLNLTAAPAVSGVMGLASAAGQTAAAVVVDPPLPVATATNIEQTDIYKIALGNGRSQFVAANTVSGSILNAYSMDEHDGYFRVATTEHAWWTADSQEHNHLFVFDPSLQPTGKLDDFAPGEEIYAARFVGNRAFLVTFQQIDPLFAIDLTSPTNPVVVGQLTLPGYSTFLLPLDENHLIGFGKDVLVADAGTNLDEYGDVPWWNGRAFYQGMKLAMFDVTDMQNPVQTDAVSIGDRGTDSLGLYDPHALLFVPARNLLAFPISVAQVSAPDPTQPWQWGNTIFQGAFVYQVSSESGFAFKGSITHKPAGQDVYATWGDEINRVLLIGTNIYTLSDSWLMSNDLASLAEVAVLALPQPPQQTYPILYGAGVSVPASAGF